MVCEGVSELEKHSPRILSCVRSLDPMVELDLNLSPASMAVLGQAVNQGFIILLCRVEIRVAEGPPVARILLPSGEYLHVPRNVPFQITLVD